MSKEKSKSEVARVETQEKALAFTGVETGNSLPDFMKKDAGKGGLESGTGDLVLGRTNLLQALSPEVAESKLFDSGHIINTVSLVDYGTSLTFIPLFDNRQAIRWAPGKRGEMDCFSSDCIKGSKNGLCHECKVNFDMWKDSSITKEERKDLCTTYLNFPSIVNGEDLPVIISFEKTKYKVGSQLKNLYVHLCSKAGTTVPMYAFKFTLGVVSQKNTLGSFYNYSVANIGYTTKEEYEMAAKWYQTLKSTQYKAEIVSESADKAF